MKVISCFDLLKADPLKGMNIFDLVHLDNIDKVYDVLRTIGMNVDEPVHIYAAQHRTLSNEVKIGYLFAGELSLKREHLKGAYSMPDDVLIAASLQDKSLFEELHAMNTRSPQYGGDSALDKSIPVREDDEFRAEEIRIANEIAQLEDLLYHIRGSQLKSDGSVKTLNDYKTPEQPVEKKRRKKKAKEGKVDV